MFFYLELYVFGMKFAMINDLYFTSFYNFLTGNSMTKVNRFKIEQYEQLKSIGKHKKPLDDFPNKNIKIDFKQDYMLSSKIQQHINSTNSDLANKSIRFLNTSLNINTFDQNIGLKLSFIINSQVFNTENTNSVNYNFNIELESVPFVLQDGSFTDFDDQLFKAINKLVRLFDTFSKEKSISIDQLDQQQQFINELVDKNNPVMTAYLNDIISLIYAKGKFHKGIKPGSVYEKGKTTKKMYIPYYRLDPDHLDLQLKVEEQKVLPVEINQHQEKRADTQQHFLQQFMYTGQVFIKSFFLYMDRNFWLPLRKAVNNARNRIIKGLFSGRGFAIIILLLLFATITILLNI